MLWELVIRCPVCGRKYPYQVSPDIYQEYEDKIFFAIPCPKCKPQISLESYFTHEHAMELSNSGASQ